MSGKAILQWSAVLCVLGALTAYAMRPDGRPVALAATPAGGLTFAAGVPRGRPAVGAGRDRLGSPRGAAADRSRRRAHADRAVLRARWILARLGRAATGWPLRGAAQPGQARRRAPDRSLGGDDPRARPRRRLRARPRRTARPARGAGAAQRRLPGGDRRRLREPGSASPTRSPSGRCAASCRSPAPATACPRPLHSRNGARRWRSWRSTSRSRRAASLRPRGRARATRVRSRRAGGADLRARASRLRAELVPWLIEELGLSRGSRVLDLAAGTGQLSRLFAGRVGSLVAVEPAAPMRAVLAAQVPGAEVLEGVAERLPLPDGSVDAAVVGNAFHRFDGPAAVARVARVLKPGGGLAVVWNIGLESDPPSPDSRLVAGLARASRGRGGDDAGMARRAGRLRALRPAGVPRVCTTPAPRTARRSPPTSRRSRSSPRCRTATPRSRGSGRCARSGRCSRCGPSAI